MTGRGRDQAALLKNIQRRHFNAMAAQCGVGESVEPQIQGIHWCCLFAAWGNFWGNSRSRIDRKPISARVYKRNVSVPLATNSSVACVTPAQARWTRAALSRSTIYQDLKDGVFLRSPRPTIIAQWRYYDSITLRRYLNLLKAIY